MAADKIEQQKPDPPIAYNFQKDCVRCGRESAPFPFYSNGEYGVCFACHDASDISSSERKVCSDPVVVMQFPERPKNELDKFWEKE